MEELDDSLTSSYMNAKRMVLLEIVVLFVVLTMLQVGFARNRVLAEVLSVLGIFGYGIGILAWCKADSVERGDSLGSWFPYIIVLFGTLGFVYYLFRSRGFPKALASFGYFILFAVGTFVVSMVFGIVLGIVMEVFKLAMGGRYSG
jgi:hypothetical protein